MPMIQRLGALLALLAFTSTLYLIGSFWCNSIDDNTRRADVPYLPKALGRRRLKLQEFRDPKKVQRKTDRKVTQSNGPDSTTQQQGEEPTFVIFLGLEGVGHHLVRDLLVRSPAMETIGRLGLCTGDEQTLDLKKLQYSMLSGGRETKTKGGLFNPHLQYGGGFDSRSLFATIVNALRTISAAVASSTSPGAEMMHIPINLNGCGNEDTLPMMSYPTYKGDHRALNTVNLDIYYSACREAGVRCSHAYLYRDAYDVLLSAQKRGFNEDAVTAMRLYTLELQLLYAQMTQYPSGNAGCFGFLDSRVSLFFDEYSWFARMFGWTTTEAFMEVHGMVYSKANTAMRRRDPKIVKDEWSIIMDAFKLSHERVIDLCYSSMASP